MGLALRQASKDIRLVGHDREPAAATAARKTGAVDRTEWNLPASVEKANIVVLALPLSQIRDTLAVIGPELPDGCLVTDTAAVKVPVLAWAQELLPPRVHFVGGDPVGARNKGAEPAADRFVQTTYCLCPDATTPPEAVERASDLAAALGATPHYLDAAEHDGLLAALEQLPFILSMAVLQSASTSGAWRELVKLGGGHFEQLIAVVGDHPEAEFENARANAANLSRWLTSIGETVDALRILLASEEPDGREQAVKHLAEARAAWERHDAEAPRPSPDYRSVGMRRMLFGF